MRQFNVRRLVAKLKSLLRLRNLILLVAVVIFYNSIAFRRGFEGRVVDSATRQPIEGVVVLAHWRLKYYLVEAQDGGALQLIETVTDKDGKFHIPGWIKMYSPTRGNVASYQDPELLLFKGGYQFKRARNFSKKERRLMLQKKMYKKLEGEDVLPDEWNGHTFELRLLVDRQDRMESTAAALDYLNGSVVDRYEIRHCTWKKIATFYRVASTEYVALEGRQSKRPVRLAEDWRDEIAKCGQSASYGWIKE